MKECCMEKQHFSLLFADLDGKDVKLIVAAELHYHRSCYRECTRKQKSIAETESANQVIFNYVRETLIEGNKVIYNKDLPDAYKNSLPLEEEAVTDVRHILEKILKEFENISLYKPTNGKRFLYKESLSKGQIIILYILEIHQLQEKIEKIEKVNKIPNQEDSINWQQSLLEGKFEICLTHTQIGRRPPQNCVKAKLLCHILLKSF